MSASGEVPPGAGRGTQVRLHRDGGVATLVLGSGQRMNALGMAGWAELAAAAGALAADPPAVVVVRGAGQTFCAGFDLREWVDASPERVDATFAAMETALGAVEAIPAPTVAVVHGAATGAGCQILLACDLHVAAEDARIGMPIGRHGILVSAPFALRLATLVGPARARDLLYTGRLLSGAEAAATGLVTRAQPGGDVDRAADELVATLCEQPTEALRAIKRSVRSGLEPLWQAAAAAPVTRSADDLFPRRVAAFLDGDRHTGRREDSGGPASHG
jgi:enoyl-CoA hydratase